MKIQTTSSPLLSSNSKQGKGVDTKNNKPKNSAQETLQHRDNYQLSDKAKELSQQLAANKLKEVVLAPEAQSSLGEPKVFYLSGFDWFGASSVKGNYDGIKEMALAGENSSHYAWDQQEQVLLEIGRLKNDTPLVLVGHSFGGDSVVEVAEKLNSLKHGFRTIDLLVTLDSVGFNNDLIPSNVKKNLNYVAQGPYRFLNDTANMAKDFNSSKVENYLVNRAHSDLDDDLNIQKNIFLEISKLA